MKVFRDYVDKFSRGNRNYLIIFLKYINNYDYDEINKIRLWSVDLLRNFVSFLYFYFFIFKYIEIRWGF